MALAIQPEVSLVIFLSAFGIASLFFDGLKTIHTQKLFFWIIVGLCFTKILSSVNSLNLNQSILESLAVLIFYFLAQWLNSFNPRVITIGIFIGSVIVFGVLFIPKMAFNFFGGELFWINEPVLATQKQIERITEFVITEKSNAWALQNTTWQGSGKVRYQLEIRSKKPFKLNIGFIHAALPNGRSDQICNVNVQWTLCTIEVNLLARGAAVLGIGGYGTWNWNNPELQTRNSRVILLTQPMPLEVLTDMTRSNGLVFNENAFGAQMTVVALLLAALTPAYFGGFVMAIPALLSVFLSGSRGALAAFTIGLFILFLARSRFYKTLPLILLFCFAGVAFLQFKNIQTTPAAVPSVTQQSGIRSLNIADQDSARGRLEIWRLATKAWLENPRTFLIGTGDLSAAMKVKLDARATGYGLTKDTLTHAHNLWLQTAGESGLVGLLAMLWLWGWVILKAWRSRDAGALALLAAIFVINSVDYLFFYAPVHLAFWMAAAGLKQPEPSPDALKTA